MPTIEATLNQLLPGTAGRKKAWKECPPWPPDVFAVAASLVSADGCYAGAAYTNGNSRGAVFSRQFRENVVADGKEWASAAIPQRVAKAWSDLVARGENSVGEPRSQRWHRDALYLLSVADQACAGFGFVSTPGETHNDSPMQLFCLEQYRQTILNRRSFLPHLPSSLCIRVPPEAACVQPKAVTAQVGSTIRSLSHNLALLPARGEVSSHWILDPERSADRSDVNLLLVPFPYHADSSCFEPVGRGCYGNADFFQVSQRWLRDGRRKIRAKELATFIRELIALSGAQIHGVIFPELALTDELAFDTARRLDIDSELEFFICGAASEPGRRGGLPRNEVFTALFSANTSSDLIFLWNQSKHHRWRLDPGQIGAYDLQQLRTQSSYWENIDITNRAVMFWPLRHGATVGTLICEDLARIDPVQPLFRAVGPNLVIALLMDGPQLERRWPGRFATSLADDPGSSVLTVNSLALIRRSERHASPAYKISLFKQPNASARELELERGSHALVLRLRYSREENWTADGRSDNGMTVRLVFDQASSVRHAKPPAWASYG